MGTPTTDIGPGLGAFVAFFALAVLLWLLMRNMNARMRRMAYRERDRVEALEGRATGESDPSGSTGEAGEAPEAREVGEVGEAREPQPGSRAPKRSHPTQDRPEDPTPRQR